MTISHDLELDPVATAGRVGAGSLRAACVLAVTAAALLIWVVADRFAGVDLTVGSGAGAREVGPGAVTVVSGLAGLAAAGLAWLLARLTSRPRRSWTVLASSTLVVSLVGPLGAASPAAGLTLAAMHVVVGATLIVGVGRTLDARRVRA
jgi:hypothetical protein